MGLKKRQLIGRFLNNCTHRDIEIILKIFGAVSPRRASMQRSAFIIEQQSAMHCCVFYESKMRT